MNDEQHRHENSHRLHEDGHHRHEDSQRWHAEGHHRREDAPRRQDHDLRGRQDAHRTHHGKRHREDDEDERKAVRSTLKKVEKLKQCTKDLDAELEDVEHQKRKAKQAARENADATKAEFLRNAAVIQRQNDEDTDELRRLRATTERTQPEVEEHRRRLKELAESTSIRRAALERERDERIREVEDEIEQIEALLSGYHRGAEDDDGANEEE